jgi:hypothetical protein
MGRKDSGKQNTQAVPADDFKSVAHRLGCDEDTLGKIAKTKPAAAKPR